ncbi:MAG: hypothetical protein ABI612_13685 [Betaproteobacteria bacterium]
MRNLSVRATCLGVFALVSLSTIVLSVHVFRLYPAHTVLRERQNNLYAAYLLAD